jgi:hypothetical protein
MKLTTNWDTGILRETDAGIFCVGQLSDTVTKNLRWINLKGKDLLHLIVSEVSVHSHCLSPWFCFFWTCSGVESHGEEREVEQSCLPYGGQEAERAWGRGQSQGKTYVLQGPTPQ